MLEGGESFILGQTLPLSSMGLVAPHTGLVHVSSSQISDDIPYMWNLKRNNTNELLLLNRNRLPNLENKPMVGRGRMGRWGI